MYKYLLIFEDGSMKASNNLEDVDIEAASDGYVEIVRVKSDANENGLNYEVFLGGEWSLIGPV